MGQPTDGQQLVNDVARQAGANPITLPTPHPSMDSSPAGASPTSVLQDMVLYPAWADAKDPPAWYSRCADVEALLDVTDSLEWLTDEGDPRYDPPATISVEEPSVSTEEEDVIEEPNVDIVPQTVNASNAGVSALPIVSSNMDSVVPPLPALFEGSKENPKRGEEVSDSEGKEINFFDNPADEREFVNTILEPTPEKAQSKPVEVKMDYIPTPINADQEKAVPSIEVSTVENVVSVKTETTSN